MSNKRKNIIKEVYEKYAKITEEDEDLEFRNKMEKLRKMINEIKENEEKEHEEQKKIWKAQKEKNKYGERIRGLQEEMNSFLEEMKNECAPELFAKVLEELRQNVITKGENV